MVTLCARPIRYRSTCRVKNRVPPTTRCCAAVESPPADELTEAMFARVAARADPQAGGAGGATTLADLRRMDAVWAAIRNPTGPPPPKSETVTTSSTPLGSAPEFDVIICGGTLGIFLATALQLRGVKVAVLERGKLQGRAQEWNVSREEMQSMVALGVLTEAEVEGVIGKEFNPVRIGFNGADDIWTKDVLNLGVKPDEMIPVVADRFVAAGGVLLDETAATSFSVHPDGVQARLAHDAGPRTARLLLDCMGHASPIVRQLRHGEKPDGVCCVVGTLASGFSEDKNHSSDLIYTDSDIQAVNQDGEATQYFWEAFPAGAGASHRTTYLFSYLDADPRRPSMEDMLSDYWRLMPLYQGVDLDKLQVERILFGFFPTYRSSPLQPGFDRVLQIGDASGIQSPLSFGGFGALTRHISRLTTAVQEAVEADALDRKSLALINAYNPGLSSAWMLQRAMSVRPGTPVPPNLINRMLGSNFQAMADRGDAVMKPFLQDVMKFGPFGQTVMGQMAADPLFIPQLLAHVGPLAMLDWARHFVAMGGYQVAHAVLSPLRGKTEGWDAAARFRARRLLDAFEYGSGQDH